MPAKVLLLSAFLLLAGYAHTQPGRTTVAYLKADKLFNSSNPTAVTDSLSLAGFEWVIQELQKTASRQRDTLLFQSYLKKGILLDVKNSNEEAKNAYLQAIAVQQQNTASNDSLLFRPFVYAGADYFNLNNFDSANYFLVKATLLIRRFPQLPETERLYNTLGALHYVNGNYLQSKNYFGQALEFIKTKKPFDKAFAAGLQANIAASFYKLGNYAAALGIYNTILKEKIPAGYLYNGIYMNMGKAYAAAQQYTAARACYKKINPVQLPAVLNELALSFYESQQPDSAGHYLDQLVVLKKSNPINNLDIGINDLYRADILAGRRQYLPAIQQLQNTISAFAGNFTNPDIYSNPNAFAGSYTYYRLFDALCKKAGMFESLYHSSPREQYLTGSLDAYTAALTLLAFIEKSYDTDDAKIFLKKKSEDVYSNALQVCLHLHRLRPNNGYLEKAFLISEQNKASVMAANLHQKNMAQLPGIDQSFLQAERNIKFAIARLDVKSEQAVNNAEIEKLAKEKATYEIALSALQKNLEQNSRFFQLKYHEDSRDITALRKKLTGHQALFSFYFAGPSLHVFAFTQSSFNYIKIDSATALQQETAAWVQLLKAAGDGRKFKNGVLGQQLYNHLIKPMQSMAPHKDEWIIIPDGNLYLFPFESVTDENTGKPLLATTTISYEFSSRFLVNQPAPNNAQTVNVLAFAPFVDRGAGYHQPGFEFISRLPASGQEIAGLQGNSFTGSKATKTMFLQQASNYPVIHLATHAIADVQNPAASFIAFYPDRNLPADNCLYLEEIYGMNLDACRLVVISACETGKGELVSNEGIISLGRAFAYAGCGATINSLWKADDKATAAILERFHQYLQSGYTKPKALQKAKLDYINSDALYTSPAYWSNLVLTGNIDPVYKKQFSFTWMFVAAIAGLLIAGVIWRKKRKKSRRFSQPVIS
jgi:CHAT domain-containing protein